MLNFAQPLRQKVDYFHGTKQPKVLYHVLKKQKKVWHGPYQEFYFNDQLKVSGYYFNGQKDSTWVSYTDRGQRKEVRQYRVGQKAGIWWHFLEGGAVVKRYDQDSGHSLPAALQMDVLIGYPASARAAGLEGQVSGQLHFKAGCVFDHLEIQTASDPVFAEAARQAYLKAMRLAARYSIPVEGCADGIVPFTVNFALRN